MLLQSILVFTYCDYKRTGGDDDNDDNSGSDGDNRAHLTYWLTNG